jgi:hypothetical protein
VGRPRHARGARRPRHREREHRERERPGKLTLLARNDGAIYSFGVAGAKVTTEKEGEPESDDPLDGVSLPILFGDAPAQDDKPKAKTGIGIAGTVVVNLVFDTAEAMLNGTGTVVAGDVTIDALQDTSVIAMAGGVAWADATASEGTAVGIAGAFSVNYLQIVTRAVLADATVTAANLGVNASRTGSVISGAVGAAGAKGKKGIAVAGSVTYVHIDNTTEAIVRRAAATLTGAAAIRATDRAGTIGVAGGLGYGTTVGVGAALGINIVKKRTLAVLEGRAATTTPVSPAVRSELTAPAGSSSRP